MDAIEPANVPAHDERRFDTVVRRMLRRMPDWIARRVRALLRPDRRWIRVPAGVLLIVGGFLGFLPVLGFWMAPLGCVVLAHDVPPLKRRLAPILEWGLHKWDAWRLRDREPDRVRDE